MTQTLLPSLLPALAVIAFLGVLVLVLWSLTFGRCEDCGKSFPAARLTDEGRCEACHHASTLYRRQPTPRPRR